MQFVFLLLVPVAFWLLLVRPQRQRISAQRSLLSSLTPGEEVLTSGGLIGTLVEVGDREVTVEIAPGTVVRVALAAIIGKPSADVSPETPEAPDEPGQPETFHSEDAE
jgi:preprotein translocase subunit YajC